MDNFEAYKELRKMLASYDDIVRLDAWTYRKYETAIGKLLEAPEEVSNEEQQAMDGALTTLYTSDGYMVTSDGDMYVADTKIDMRDDEVNE